MNSPNCWTPKETRTELQEVSFQYCGKNNMDNNFEHRIIEKSQLVRATLTFQWIYTVFGLNLPPTLYERNGCKEKTWKTFALWLCYTVYMVVRLIMVLWMVYINNVVVDVVVSNLDLDGITSVLSITQNIAVAFVQVIMHVSAYRGLQCLNKIRQHIAQLERDILWYYRDYECDENMTSKPFSQRCQTFRRRLFLGPLIFLIVHTILLWYVNYPLVADMMPLKDKILTIVSFQLIQTKCSEYCVMMHVVDELITALQQSLLHLKYDILRDQRGSVRAPGAKGSGCRANTVFYRKLMANQFLLSRIWCLVKYIEDYFSIPMLILFLYNGVAITHTINWSYVRSFMYYADDCCQHYRLWFILLVFINMLWTCWLSQSCIDKYIRMASILHDLKIRPQDLALKHRLREYSLQLMHQKILFTCSGFFDINLKSFGLMMLSITTYVVILIQFKLQAETEKSDIRL